MNDDPDITLPTEQWPAANAAADRLAVEDQGKFFCALADELRARIRATGRFDAIEVELFAEDAIEAALQSVMPRAFN